MMKKIIAMMLALTLLLCAACAAAETANEKVTLGTVSINGDFTLQCGLPEGYKPVPVSVTQDHVIAVIRSEDPEAPIMQLSIAYDEMYADVDRMNDLDADALTLLEQTFIDNDPDVEITYGETGYGTLLLIARHESDDLDYVSFFSIYKGYCVEFALVPSEQAADKNLTEEQLMISVDFLTDLDFIPGSVAVGGPNAVAEAKFITNLTDYDPETNTVRAEVKHTVILAEVVAEALKEGDTLIVGQYQEPIETLEKEEDGTILINNDISLRNYGGEYHVYMGEAQYLETFVTMTLNVPETLIVEDGIDAETGEPLEDPVEYTVEEFISLLTSGKSPDFATDNVYVTFDENSEMIRVERFYTPWQ